MKWKLKSCPRCGGDIFVEWDHDVWYEQCLQCSYRCDMRSLAEAQNKPAEKGGRETASVS